MPTKKPPLQLTPPPPAPHPSALNALKHGLTAAASVLLPGEDPTIWHVFEATFQRELQPVGAIEEFLAHRIAAAAWRLARVEALEGALASTPIERLEELTDAARERAAMPRWIAPDPHRYDGLAKLARHETAIERSFFRALRELQFLQENRKQKPTRPAGFTVEDATNP